MAYTVTIEPRTHGAVKVVVTDGEESHQYTGRVKDASRAAQPTRYVRWLAETFSGRENEAHAAVLEALRAQREAEAADRAAAHSEQAWIAIGPMHSTRARVECAASDLPGRIEEAISTPAPADTVIEWGPIQDVAAVDVDTDAEDPLTDDEADGMIALAKPTPWLAWRTHGGGLRMLFHAGVYPADELAAAAGIWALGHVPRMHRVEILTRTRHPLSTRAGKRCGRVVKQTQSTSGMLASIGASVPDEERDEWLESRGWAIGQRLPHTECPIDHVPTSGSPPVVITESGIHCYRCQQTTGSGFRPWAVVLKRFDDSDVWMRRMREAARHLVIWSHAWVTVREGLGSYAGMLPPVLHAVARDAYRLLARLHHGPSDPRIPSLTRDWGVVRGTNGWLDAETLAPVLPRVDRRMTDTMPSAQFVDGDGEIRVCVERASRHQTDQRIDGYLPVAPILSDAVWARTGLPYARGDFVRVSSPVTSKYPPQSGRVCSWRNLSDRGREWLPGLDITALRLVLAAKAWAESGYGAVPIILLTGPTGAAKSATTRLAAAICGGRTGLVRFDPNDPIKTSEAIAMQAASSSILLLDEFAKGTGTTRRNQAASQLLDVDRIYSYRQLRVGPTSVYLTVPLILTETDIGEEWEGYAQFARRVVHHRIPRSIRQDWRETVGDVTALRDHAEKAKWADDVLATAAADWSRWGITSWDRWFAELGVSTILDQTTRTGATRSTPIAQPLRDIWEYAQSAPTESVPGLAGEWTRIDPTAESPEARAWRALCAPGRATPTSLRRIERAREIDLSTVLEGVSDIAVVPADGGTLLFRFELIEEITDAESTD